MYKLVDDQGRVTYTNVPPPDAAAGKSATIIPGTLNVSTYSSAEALGKKTYGSNDRQLKDRVERLERELEIERRARALALEMVESKAGQAAQAAQRLREKRERCIADRRVDCDKLDSEDGHATTVVAAARRQSTLTSGFGMPPLVVRQVVIRPVAAPLHAATPHAHPPHRHAHAMPTSALAPAVTAQGGTTLVIRAGHFRRH
jgi:hypothetical protein